MKHFLLFSLYALVGFQYTLGAGPCNPSPPPPSHYPYSSDSGCTSIPSYPNPVDDVCIPPDCPSAPARGTDCALTIYTLAVPFLIVAGVAVIILTSHHETVHAHAH